MRRVVITGMGVVSCLGNELETVWRAVAAGRSGLAPMERWDPTGLRNPRMGEVKDFPWDDEHDEAGQFALHAAEQALGAAGLLMEGLPGGDSSRVGLVSSTNFGGAASWDQYLASLQEGYVDAEIAERARRQPPRDLVRNRPDAELQRRALTDQPGHVIGDGELLGTRLHVG